MWAVFRSFILSLTSNWLRFLYAFPPDILFAGIASEYLAITKNIFRKGKLRGKNDFNERQAGKEKDFSEC